MMQVTVKLFAILRDRAEVSEVLLDLPEASDVSAASSALAEQFPAIRDFLPRIAYAVNREYAPASTMLEDGDELALIPPVSGG
jgi:molybdopterin converting factor subunit 1